MRFLSISQGKTAEKFPKTKLLWENTLESFGRAPEWRRNSKKTTKIRNLNFVFFPKFSQMHKHFSKGYVLF